MTKTVITVILVIVALIVISIMAIYIPKPYKYFRIVKTDYCGKYRVQCSYHGILWWNAKEVIDYMGDCWSETIYFDTESDARDYINNLKKHYENKRTFKKVVINV